MHRTLFLRALLSSATAAPATTLTSSSSSAVAPKTLLYDKFQRKHDYLRISLVERCNLRCQYCMPEQGIELTPKESLLQHDEIMSLVRLFAKCGVKKIRLTGGEPLLYPRIVDLVREIKSCGIQTIGMTTNGILLHRYIEALHEAGLNRLNISLDTLDESKYMLITRRNGLKRVLDSIQMALALGDNPVKINCVVMRGVNTDELTQLALLAKDQPIEVRFIEYMPFDDNKWSRNKMFSFMETVDVIESGIGAKLKAGPCGETAKLFNVDGWVGRLGFITSMTTNFCGTCNRLRLTADGNLKNCLFGDDEVSLRDALRGGATEDALEVIIRASVQRKHASHGGKATPEAIAASLNRPMIKIGG
jgi:molybdenum cofactor biosynthesis protein A